MGRPKKTLIGFERVHLSPSETKSVVFNVTMLDFALAGMDGNK